MTDHCTAEVKCWEHWQGWTARATMRDINLATSLMQLYAATGNVVKTREACDMVIELTGRQWREMLRQPFQFRYAPHLEKPTPKAKLTLDDVLDLL